MKKMHTLSKLILIYTLLLTTPISVALAHGEDGLEFTAQGDGYTADMDYSSSVIESGGSTGRFSFSVFADEARTEGVEFSDLWVTITKVSNEGSKRGSPIFAGPINRPDFGAVGFTYAFYEPGPYVVSVRYMNEGEKITQVEFPIDVIESTDNTTDAELPLVPIGSALLGLVVGVGATLVVTSRKKDKQSPTDQ